MQTIERVRRMWTHLASHPELRALPRWRQLLEMATLYALRGIGPGYFVNGSWWRQDIPFAEKWAHMNRSEYRRFINRVNPAEYRKASQHKVVEKAVLQLLGLPTASCHGFYHPVRGRRTDGRPLRTPQDLAQLLHAHVGRRLCFKPVEGYGGHGFQALDVVKGHDSAPRLAHPIRGSVQTVSEFAAGLPVADGYLVEDFLHQHAELSDINPHSLNTLRMWVCDVGGEIVTVAAMLRVGRAGRQTDNTSRGGIPCPIDVATGRVVAALDTEGSSGRYLLDAHPDSGARLVGRAIPLWSDCQLLAAAALSAFPHMRLAGLDIAVTTEGPRVVELNTMPDYIGCSYMRLPLRLLAARMNSSTRSVTGSAA